MSQGTRYEPLTHLFVKSVLVKVQDGCSFYFTVTRTFLLTPFGAITYTILLPFFFALTLPLRDTDITFSFVTRYRISSVWYTLLFPFGSMSFAFITALFPCFKRILDLNIFTFAGLVILPFPVREWKTKEFPIVIFFPSTSLYALIRYLYHVFFFNFL